MEKASLREAAVSDREAAMNTHESTLLTHEAVLNERERKLNTIEKELDTYQYEKTSDTLKMEELGMQREALVAERAFLIFPGDVYIYLKCGLFKLRYLNDETAPKHTA